MKRASFFLLLGLTIACSDDAPSGTGGAGGVGGSSGSGGSGEVTDCADAGTCTANPLLEIGADRPATVTIPSDYDPGTTRYPLIIVLHGFGVNGATQAAYFSLFGQVDAKDFILVAPDGTLNAEDRRFWNATPACCAQNDEERAIDDVAYIRSLIAEARRTYSIDSARVYLFGHSNGGFMSFRMACEASDVVTAIVSLAGSTFDMPSECAPATQPVSVLAIHGDEDDTILYDGIATGYPGAVETARRFAERAGCDTDPVRAAENIDIDGSIVGAETTVDEYANCDDGLDVALWTIEGGEHIPLPWTEAFPDLTTDWLLAHSR